MTLDVTHAVRAELLVSPETSQNEVVNGGA